METKKQRIQCLEKRHVGHQNEKCKLTFSGSDFQDLNKDLTWPNVPRVRLRKSPGVGNGNPLQYSCLGNPTDRGAWWTIVHGVAKSQTRVSNYTTTYPMSPGRWDSFLVESNTFVAAGNNSAIFLFVAQLF